MEINQLPAKAINGFEAVYTVPTETLVIPFGNHQEMFIRMSKTEGDAKVSHPTDVIVEIKKVIIIFKAFCPEKKIIHMDENKVEKCLASIWNNMTCKMFATI